MATNCGCDDVTMLDGGTMTGAGTNGTAAKPPPGVAVASALERLIYFNGRFLKAEDLKLEQKGYLKRIALSERSQGAGVSYGFHVTHAQKPATSSFVKQVASEVFNKMKQNRTEWEQFLDDADEGTPPLGDEALVDRLAAALDALCGADPGNADEITFNIAPGHAADGYGHDLLLANPQQVKLSTLIDAFEAAPTSTDKPGPAVTPTTMTSAPPLTGAFLLTIYLDFKDHGNVPIYGAQCTDAKMQACSLGFRSDGVGAQLVFFDALDGAVAAADWWTWRGMGARAYFDKETEVRNTLLPQMESVLPFSNAASAPETGTHVPIGVVYLQNGNFVTFDPWTAKRLRSPGELTFWLRALLYPAQVSQLARVVQFESQLTDALAAGVAGGSRNLWNLGFADGAELVLPGVGFLPIDVEAGGAGDVTAAQLTPALNTFFDGVPYRSIQATPGEMNAIFVGALESVELRLTRTTTPAPAPTAECDELVTGIRTAVDAALAGTVPPDTAIGNIDTLIDAYDAEPEPPPPAPTGPPQVFVWWTPSPYPGYVMFTWPAPLPSTTQARPRVCTHGVLGTGPREARTTFEVVGHDGDWTTSVASGFGQFYTMDGFRLELEQPFGDLGITFDGVNVDGTALPKDAEGNVVFDESLSGIRIGLTGAAAADYDVLYRLRLRVNDLFYFDTHTFRNNQLLGEGTMQGPGLDPTVFETQLDATRLRFYPPGGTTPPPMEIFPEGIWVSIVPKCPMEDVTRISERRPGGVARPVTGGVRPVTTGVALPSASRLRWRFGR
jgi:hypothetical protein